MILRDHAPAATAEGNFSRQLADYHDRLGESFEQASRRPWLALPPYPPLPVPPPDVDLVVDPKKELREY